jgi:hypothetical protein
MDTIDRLRALAKGLQGASSDMLRRSARCTKCGRRKKRCPAASELVRHGSRVGVVSDVGQGRQLVWTEPKMAPNLTDGDCRNIIETVGVRRSLRGAEPDEIREFVLTELIA